MGIIIGSTAIKHWWNDFPREPKDLDIIVKKNKKNEKGVEYLLNPVMVEKYNPKGGHVYMKPNDLYTLKMSHCVGWSINWDKHVYDLQFLKRQGCRVDRELFHRLYEYWNTVHEKNRRSDLEMSAEDFFDNAFPDGHLHDYYHTLLNPSPTYLKVLKDGAEVDVSEEKFNTLSFEDKCNLVYEEVEVMAAERYKNMKWQHAYSRMLRKFITNHSPLWEAIFILENYTLLHKPRHNFIKIIQDGINKNQSTTV